MNNYSLKSLSCINWFVATIIIILKLIQLIQVAIKFPPGSGIPTYIFISSLGIDPSEKCVALVSTPSNIKKDSCNKWNERSDVRVRIKKYKANIEDIYI